MIGRRVATIAEIEQAGDYCGPIRHPDDGTESCWFLLPIARDEGVESGARSMHRVAFPPHTYRECPDGSLEIRNSIASLRGDGSHIWHGFLDEGHVWRTA